MEFSVSVLSCNKMVFKNRGNQVWNDTQCWPDCMVAPMTGHLLVFLLVERMWAGPVARF